MGIVESGLSKLFDYQKYEKEPKLQSVIDEAENGYKGYSGMRKLTDLELENAAGGVEITGSNEDDPQQNGRCKMGGCTSYLKKTPYGYICPGCHTTYDKDKNPTDPADPNKKMGFRSFF